LQNILGNITSGSARFDISTSGFNELYSNVSVTGALISSSGFVAQIGMPGDQLSQGGSISYSTKWSSEQAIGYDPLSGQDIILGSFFLNSTNPLTSFLLAVDDPAVPLISTTFTIGEKYILSTGLEIDGYVTKELKTVPTVPAPLPFLGVGVAFGAARKLRKRIRHYKLHLNQ
jgi:hypothetical protein